MGNRYLAALYANLDDRADTVFCRQIAGGTENVITWRMLGTDMGRFGAAYRAAGLRPGDQILIFLRHVPQLYGSFFGAMAAGMTPAFMPCTSPRQDPTLYWNSHRRLLETIRPAAIVTDRSIHGEMIEAGLDLGDARLILIEETEPAPLLRPVVHEDSVGLLQHSSGTTGLKKGVALSFDAIAKQVERYGAVIDITGGDVIASWLPLYHDMGLIACMIAPAFYGVPVIHIDPFQWVTKPATLFDMIVRHQATLCWLPNFAFDHLALTLGRQAARYDLSHMRAFISCSEPVKAASLDRFIEAFAVSGIRPHQLQTCYAMAETVFAVSQSTLERPIVRKRFDPATLAVGSIPVEVAGPSSGRVLPETGTPIEGVEISFHGPMRERLADDAVGEIAIRCDFLFAGYNRDPAATARSFHEARYFTRDMGFQRDGRLYVLGRLDDMIIVNGRNLYAHEVEAELNGIEGLKPGRVVAVGLFDDRIGSQTMVLLAERKTGTLVDDDAIIRNISNRVSSVFEVKPRVVELMSEGALIKTTSGKISRSENLKRFLARRGENSA